MENAKDQVVTSVWRTLRWTFGLIPIAAGADKFFNLLTYWPKYVAPLFSHLSPLGPQRLMHVAGLIEIVAGLAILLSPWTRTFAFVVAAWLAGIAINLIAGGYYDIAVRDLAMAVAALSFARLSAVVVRQSVTAERLVAARTSA
jgi:uncharacterized membrane protein YphA (DoxX/SURF4 family)